MLFILKILLTTLLFLNIFFNTGLAASYYVDATNGNDSNTGRSHAQAWKTLRKVNQTSFNPGDDVYLHCGKTWTGQALAVNWSGSSSNPVIIGAYYMAGSEKIGVNSAGKPIIDGKNSYPMIDFGYLVGVERSNDYVVIQDLDIRRSKQYGVKISAVSDHCTIRRCNINDTYRENIYFSGSSNYGKVEYCKLTKGSRMRLEMIGADRGWPAAGIQMGKTNYGMIQYNWIYDQYSEAIILGHDAICMYNLIGDSMSVGIYCSGQKNTEIAYNLVYGTDSKYYNSYHSSSSVQSDWKGNGIVAGLEVVANSDLSGVKIHHNIVINRLSGIRVYNTNATAKLISLDICNNTLIDNRFSFNISNNDDKVDGKVTLRNNISYPKHPDANHLNFAGASLRNWLIDHNTWAIDDAPNGIWSGTGDVNIDPLFSKARWKGYINATSDFTAVKMMPTVSALGNGVNIGSYYNKFIDPSSDYSTLNPDPNKNDPITVALSLKSALTPWPMGAVKMTTGSSIVSPPKLFITN